MDVDYTDIKNKIKITSNSLIIRKKIYLIQDILAIKHDNKSLEFPNYIYNLGWYTLIYMVLGVIFNDIYFFMISTILGLISLFFFGMFKRKSAKARLIVLFKDTYIYVFLNTKESAYNLLDNLAEISKNPLFKNEYVANFIIKELEEVNHD